MKISKITAAFLLRFDAEVDQSITDAEMEMFDPFSARSPVGGKFLVQVRQRMST